MTEKELQELDFEKIIVTVEESGDKNEYYYYKYNLGDSNVLMSTPSDEASNNNWYVHEYDWGITIKTIEDVELLITLFRKWTKIT